MSKEKKKGAEASQSGDKRKAQGEKAVRAKTKVKQQTQDEDAYTSDEEEEVKRIPFRFLDLPSELRLRIYDEVLLLKDAIDLDSWNYRMVAPRLSLFLVNHQIHEEAYRVFYAQPLRLFPLEGRFFHTKKPLLMRLPQRYRAATNIFEIRLGRGWTAPPRGQKITPELGLADCTNVRSLRIFVECDPSDAFFAGFRGKDATEDTYKNFCVDLLSALLEQCPSISLVEIDANPAVKRDAPLILALRAVTRHHNKILRWGPLQGWSNAVDDASLQGLESLMASMTISKIMPIVHVEA